MALKRTLFVPPFHSHLSSSQSDESMSWSVVSSLDQTPAPKLRRGNLQRPVKNPGLVLTVKLPTEANDANRPPAKKSKATASQRVLKAKVCQKKTSTASQREEPQSSAGHSSHSVGGKDVYDFSPRDEQPKSEKDRLKIKKAVLRNISRMLRENKHIRQRLESFSQVNRSHTDSNL